MDWTDYSFSADDSPETRRKILAYAKVYNSMRILLGMGGLVFDQNETPAIPNTEERNIFPRLTLNNNHHSCTIKGHYNMLALSDYSIEHKTCISDDYPFLELNEHETLYGIELQRKLLEHTGIFDTPDEDLQKIVDSHRNCPPELCPRAGE